MSTLVTRTAPPTPGTGWTAADLFEQFGPIPLSRVRHDPAPGLATEDDVAAIHDREKRLYELVDGVLVEKAVGTQESYLALFLGGLLMQFARDNNLGFALGADGMARLAPGLVRIPDISFVSWERYPRRGVPREPYLNVAPDLAVEVLSPSNTAKEMERKLRDYFEAGVRLVWFVDPRERSVQVFSDPVRVITLREPEVLDGGEVLPGFALPLVQLFEGLDADPEK